LPRRSPAIGKQSSSAASSFGSSGPSASSLTEPATGPLAEVRPTWKETRAATRPDATGSAPSRQCCSVSRVRCALRRSHTPIHPVSRVPARAVHPITSSRRNTLVRMRTYLRQEAATPRRRRLVRSSIGRAQALRRFGRGQAGAGRRSPGASGRRGRPVEQTGAQRLMQGIRGALPGRGASSAKPDERAREGTSGMGSLLSSLRGKKGRGRGRGRKPAMFGLLGVGAAGAAAAVAKRRHGSRSQPSEDETSSVREPETTSTSTQPADTTVPAETAQGPDNPAPDDSAAEPRRGSQAAPD
jgi:hypothetical protein